jgi:hypothetical protein
MATAQRKLKFYEVELEVTPSRSVKTHIERVFISTPYGVPHMTENIRPLSGSKDFEIQSITLLGQGFNLEI